MSFLLTAIAFIVIFSILVVIHEWGHFFVARKAGIKVEEFGFGLPPRIWGVKKGETLYSINAIPFGGFVKLLGEDSHDAKAIKDKRSFIAKPPRVRILVVTAGVIMNFLLAFILLTIGFTFGIQPLILSGDDVLANIHDGTIQIEEGIVVKAVIPGGPADAAGLQAGDRIYSVAGREIVSADQMQEIIGSAEKKPVPVETGRDGVRRQLQMVPQEKPGLGFQTYEIVFLPRVAIENVKAESLSHQAGLLPGDILLGINDQPIYFIDEFWAAVNSAGSLKFMVMRDSTVRNFVVNVPRKDVVIISSVFPDTPAEKAGFRRGDIIVSLNGTFVASPLEAVTYTKEHAGKDIRYELKREGGSVFLNVKPESDGLIGVGLSTIFAFENNELSVYNVDVATSVLKINDIRYPFWVAPWKALEESGRLAVLTVEMFGNVLRSVVTRFAVPEGVAGPVGIAQLTYVFVQEGVLSVMRFMALLSLSLAIINVLPFPALDGGRLLFILAEVVIGRKVGARFESFVHTIGFVLLMLLILAVTYSDILRIFSQ